MVATSSIARRRLALIATIVLVMMPAMTTITTAYAASANHRRAVASVNRLDIGFNDFWRFHLGDVVGAEDLSFDDSRWEKLDLPHTWNNLDGQDGGGDYHRGIGWYRKHYTIPRDYEDKSVYIRFEAVNKAAEVYVNGKYIGRHEGGFAAFAFDITKYIMVGKENVFAIKADNSTAVQIAPLSGDFNQDGGIYRPVHLLVTNHVHITPLDYGSSGVYLTPTKVSNAVADLEVLVKVNNAGGRKEVVTIQTTIRDMADKIVDVLTSTQVLAPFSSDTFVQNTSIDRPFLWNGRSDPYLYKATVEVKLDDTIVDEVEQPLGFRYFHIDPDKGFYLNGKSLDLHGVGMHEGREDKGRAIGDKDRRGDIDLIMELGATCIRLAHYQHAETTYDLTDENGLIVWTEIPLLFYSGNGSTSFKENIKQQLRELIRQNYNHPSVFFWGLYNVIGTNGIPLIKELNKLAHDEDVTRLTTGANSTNFSPGVDLPMDLVGWHMYRGWYGGAFEDIEPTLNTVHNYHPLLGVSEYGAGASIHHHEENPSAPDPYGDYHPEEYQNIFHETYWRTVDSMPFLWMKSAWVAFDFASDSRDEGDRPGINDKGLITFDRSVKKDAFYWYKANWSEEPVVYITSRRFTPRDNSLVEAKIYSNCDNVELLVNDVSHGSLTSIDHIHRWTDIILSGGENTIRAVCTIGTEQYEDAITWNGGAALSLLPAGLHQETDSRIIYSGTWTSYTGSEPSEGSTLLTSEENAGVRFDFEGTGLRLYRTTDSGYGPMQVCVDTVCQVVDNETPTTQWNQMITIATGLTHGTHRVSIRNLSASIIELDAVKVLGPPVVPVLLFPSDGSIISDSTPAFNWTDLTDVTQYQLRVDDNALFSSPEIDVTEVSSMYSPTVFLANGTYYWQVRTQNSEGIWSDWSVPWMITIADGNCLDIEFNDSWRFHLGDVAGAEDMIFDDSGWEELDLPHTWNNLDGQDGGGDYHRGIGWYRKHYTTPLDYADKSIFIRFEAVNKAADVYVNGVHVGRHEGGFAAFAFDITEHIVVGADNVIAIKADNSVLVRIAPLSGDFNQDGGVYRPVHLLVANQVHITQLDYGSPGVYLTPTNVSDTSADLEVVVKINNDGYMSEMVTVQTTIKDADDTIVDLLTSTQSLAASSNDTFVQSTTIIGPHLWNGRSDPYLYKAIVQIKLGETIVDEIEQPLGFRYFRIDPDTGFYLNGEPFDLHGVAMHEGRIDKGRAISDEDRREDVELIMEMGATYIRLAHYQHAETIYDLADENGLVIWTEIPLVNYGLRSTTFSENIQQQLRELIRQNYNHPSVFFWGLYNEVSPTTTNLSLVTALNDVAHAEDATRLTTGANHNRFPADTSLPMDTVSWNLYYGWYRGVLTDVSPALTDFHSHHPLLGVSEYGAGASIHHHEENPSAPDPSGDWHPEEYQNIFHESYWKQMEAMPFLWSKSIWVAFDFASDSRDEGDSPGINDKGLITFDRSVKKDSFYWYKASWSEEPVVYITSRRFTPRDDSPVEIKVYSNCDSVELLVNELSYGSLTSTDHIHRWMDVILSDGDNAIRAVCTIDTEQYEDEITWNGGL